MKTLSPMMVRGGCVLLLIVCFTGRSTAQIGGGSFVGVVTDPSGAVISGALVKATNVGTNQVSESTTNQLGYYEFTLLPAGRYVLSAEQQGFQKATTAELKLHSGTKPRIDFQMVVGEVTQTVEVIDSTPLVNATTTELGVVVDSQKVRDLPLNGRTFTQLLGLQPGYNVGSSSGSRGGVELNGLPGLGNNWLMDGIDISFGENNGVGLGAIGGSGAVINTVSIEAIEEFKTSSGAFSAEYGRATGGAINLATKSGTNQFHGTLFEFFRNDKLDATSFFSNVSGLKKANLRHNQYGGNLGGPIVRDKLFFFFNYEGARIRRGRTITGNVATPELRRRITNPALAKFLEFYPKDFQPTSNPLIGFHARNDAQRVDEDTTLSRVDGQVKNHRLSFRLAWNEQTVSNPRVEPSFRQFLPLPLRNWTVSDYFVISPTVSNEARFGFNHYPIARHIRSTNPSDNVQVPGVDVPLTREGRTVVAPGLATLLTVDSLISDSPTYMFVDNLSAIRGAHTFKTGFEVRRIDSTRTQYGQGVWHFYNSVDDLINDQINSLELPFGNPSNGYKFWSYAGYVQDDWKVNPRFQLNLGLRYEYYSVFKGSIGLATADPFGGFGKKGDPLWKPDRNNFAPRLGLVIDLTGRGKTIFRAGGGISYGAPQPFYYYDAAWIDARVPFAPVLNVVDLPASLKPITFPFPDSFLEAVRKDPSKVPPGLAPGMLAPDINRRDEYSAQWNFSLQHALSDTLAVQAAYVGNRALKLYTSRLLNPINPATGTRPRPEIGPAWFQNNAGRLWYHSMQLSVNKRLSRGLTFDAYYTWARAMQFHGADAVFTRDGQTQDFSNIGGSIGPKQGEINHRFTLVHSYQLPTPDFANQSMVGRGVLGGWTLQGILDARSGAPVNVVIGRDVVGNGQGGPQRPDAVPGIDALVGGPDRLLWLARSAFDVTGPTQQRRFGNLGYNAVRGPGAFSWDVGIHKSFQLHEAHRLTLRLEMFNWLNHVRFDNPINSLANPNFGRITSGSDGRNIQLALKYTF